MNNKPGQNLAHTAPANIPELVATRLTSAREKPFLFSEADGRRFTYGEFDQAVNRVVRLLRSKGIGKGDAVSLLMPNSAEYIIAYFACWKLGAIAGPVNSLLKGDEVAFVISDSEAKAIMVNSEFLPIINNIRSQLPSLKAVIEFDDESETTKEFSESPEGSTNLVLPEINSDDEAIIIYTSGTTGKPKGCLLTHGNLIANARQISEWLGFTNDDRLLSVTPPRNFLPTACTESGFLWR